MPIFNSVASSFSDGTFCTSTFSIRFFMLGVSSPFPTATPGNIEVFKLFGHSFQGMAFVAFFPHEYLTVFHSV